MVRHLAHPLVDVLTLYAAYTGPEKDFKKAEISTRGLLVSNHCTIEPSISDHFYSVYR